MECRADATLHTRLKHLYLSSVCILIMNYITSRNQTNDRNLRKHVLGSKPDYCSDGKIIPDGRFNHLWHWRKRLENKNLRNAAKSGQP